MKTPKKPKAPKAPKPAKAAKKAKAAPKEKKRSPRALNTFSTGGNEQDRELFLHHLPKISDLKAKLNTANANLRNAYKQAKADNFLKKDFDTAFQIQQAEGEKAKKAAIARDLTIAKWLGCDLGAQLDLFVEDERVPAAERAYEEGKTASMQNMAAVPGYDPSTEQAREYMRGFHEHQATLASGIKPLAPASGVAMTRAEFKAQQAAKDGAGDLSVN